MTEGSGFQMEITSASCTSFRLEAASETDHIIWSVSLAAGRSICSHYICLAVEGLNGDGDNSGAHVLLLSAQAAESGSHRVTDSQCLSHSQSGTSKWEKTG